MDKEKLNLKALKDLLPVIMRRLAPYGFAVFIIFVAAAYAFVFMRANGLVNQEPTQEAINSQSNPIRSAKVDPAVVKQLESLRDNSVGVETLFDEARDNPFQEIEN